MLALKINRLEEIKGLIVEQKFTPSQFVLLSAYAQRHLNNVPLRFKVLGRPGVGKTFILEVISDLDILVFDENVARCAYTGTCADRLKTKFASAHTLHEFFGLITANRP